jgi:hypothetical protein
MGTKLTATDEDLQRLAHHRMVVRRCALAIVRAGGTAPVVLRIKISNAEQTLDAFVKIGVPAEQRRNDDRAIEAANSLQQRAPCRRTKARRRRAS